MDLGTTITRLRTQRGLSQGDLAEALEVSRQSVSKWETNASVPDLEKLVKLSRFFDISLDELVTGETPPQSESSVEQPPSHPLQQEVPPPHIRSGQRAAAIILLCMGFLVWLLLTLLGGPLQGVFLAAPFLACAAICFWTKRRTGLWSAWAVYLSVELYLRWATGLTWALTLHTFSFTQGGKLSAADHFLGPVPGPAANAFPDSPFLPGCEDRSEAPQEPGPAGRGLDIAGAAAPAAVSSLLAVVPIPRHGFQYRC